MSATFCALPAPSAVRLTPPVTSPRAATVSSRLAACCSVRWARSLEATVISVRPVRIEPTAERTWPIAPSSSSTEALNFARIGSNSGATSPDMRTVRSPAESRSKPASTMPTKARRSSALALSRAAWRCLAWSWLMRAASASSASRSRSIAWSLKTCTAPAISPISSLRPMAGTATSLSPAASRRMAAVIALIGREIERASGQAQPIRTRSRRADHPRVL